MKARVIKSFIDKYSGVSCDNGAIIEISKERFEEINSTALGIFVEEVTAKKSSKK